MSFMKKLCDVYDAVVGTSGAEGDGALLPVGFVQKNVKYNIILSPSGEFVIAQLIPDGEQSCAVPSSPQAEARTSSKCAPFPLAEQLKYLIAGGKYFDSYVAQLEAWCAEEHAPECLRVLLDYLKRETLYADLAAVSGLKLKYYKDESDTKGDGADAKSFACFSVEYPDSVNRLWMRKDVRESWARRLAAMAGEQTELCYVTGLPLPAMENHPKVQGNAKLISAKDTGFPVQFRGRFVADRSAATVSGLVSSKAHSALRWLLNHQGFQKYGMNFVGWYTGEPALDLGDDEDGERPVPDTFESYINALFRAVQGYERDWKAESDLDDLTDEAKAAMDEVVILGLQAATDGRMSVTYEQEIPGNVFIDHVDRWRAACRWQMPHQEELDDDRSPTWREICEAVMGVDAVQTARGDFKAEKAATKLMRDLQLRLLHCVVEAQALPRNMLEAAFHRAVQPLTFTDSKGRWKEWDWRKCIAVACAMIRAHEIEKPVLPQSVLDTSCTERDYLYGRLLAVAHKLELDASQKPDRLTAALRRMPRFVQAPGATWLRLYCELDGGAHLEGEIAQIERMEKLIYSLLRLERLCGSGYDFHFAPHDASEIARRAWRPLGRLWPDRAFSIEGTARVRCDEKWLGEALGNLFRNACEHTAAGGSIRVHIEQGEASAQIVVEDDGGGVDKADLPHLFERFYRAKSAETGASMSRRVRGNASVALRTERTFAARASATNPGSMADAASPASV